MNILPTATGNRQLGSAKDGVSRWWGQRLSSVALLPLSLWLIVSLASLPDLSHATVQQWLALPTNAFLMLAFIPVAYYHMASGLRVIVEDYISLPWLKITSIAAVEMAAFMLALISMAAALKLFL